ncbi:DNA-directed DNA polymerase [Tanacetum coccineum]|uniref:DNA-directed DNA polymerase n=1 Tax=Tanacetum coccineum TaxID=301880 RepID=A0ABQ5GGN7_9ASTR
MSMISYRKNRRVWLAKLYLGSLTVSGVLREHNPAKSGLSSAAVIMVLRTYLPDILSCGQSNTVTSKFDMHIFTYTMTVDEVNSMSEEYGIPLELRPHVPSSTLTMNNLPVDAIDANSMSQFLKFPMVSGVHIGRVKHEDERVLAAKRKAQEAKERAASKRPALGGPSHRTKKKKKTAPISMALSNNLDLQSSEHVEEEVGNTSNNDDNDDEVNYPYFASSLRFKVSLHSEHSLHSEGNVNIHSSGVGLHRTEGDGNAQNPVIGCTCGSLRDHMSPSVPFVPAWNLTTGSSLKDAESCRDMMINLATPSVRSQHNRLSDHQALQRACIGREVALTEKLVAIKREKEDLFDKKKDQEEQIKKLEEALASKTCSLSEAEKTVDNLKKDLERQTVDLGQAEIVRHNYVRQLLLTVIQRLLASDEYKNSLSEPFNQVIAAGWSEGVKVDRTNEEIQAILATADNYDPECHSTFVSAFDALFTKSYPYVERTTEGVDINTLTIEQYLALSRENQAPGVVKQEIRGNVNFEIKSQFMRELREDTCSKNKNEDAHDHVDRVLNIVSFFNIFGVSQDAVLLRVFPFTLTGSAKRWVDRLTPGAVNTWDLLKKPLSKGAASGLRPYHFTYPERKLTMEEMLYKFIDEGKREHEEMRAFIKPLAVNHNEAVKSNEVLTNDQPQKTNEPDAQPSNKIQTPPIPFPRRSRREKEEAQQKKFLENRKQLHINLPFIEALAQMPKYAKFLTGLLTNKARLEEACTITMNERCSAVLLNKLPSKEKDTGSFTIPCDIVQLHINNALADLGASISLMPYTMYEKLGLGEPKATRMSLKLADRSIKYPRGMIENVLIKVDKFILSIDFVILDMPEDSRVPIILGRPFLAIARAMIDIFNKKIMLKVGDDEVIFDVDQSIKTPPTKDDECYGIDDLDDTINAEAQKLLANEEPESFLSRGLEKSIDQSDLEGCELFECETNNDSS